MNARELLPEFVLGLLGAEETAAVERAVAADPHLKRELRELEDALSGIAITIPPVKPSPRLRERVVDSIAHMERFAGFTEIFADLLKSGVERARALLHLIDDEAAWREVFSGCFLIHIRPSPALVGADVGLVKLEKNCKFPHHIHHGEEDVLILQGALRDNHGKILRAGERPWMPAGSSHSFEVVGDEALIYAVVVWGVEIPGVPVDEVPEEEMR